MRQTSFSDTAKRCVRRGEAPSAFCLPSSLCSWSRIDAFAALALITAFALSSPSLAEAEAPGGAELDLRTALTRAAEHNKELAAFEYQFKEQEGRVEQAGLIPNPNLSLVVEDAVGSGSFEGFDSAQTTLSLGWVLERTIRRRRVAAAEAGSALLLTDAEILRLDLAAETAQRFLSSLATQTRLENAEEAVALAEDTVTAVSRRVRAGKSPSAELSRAEAGLATAKLARDDVGHELAIAYHRLAAQWGEVEPGFSRVSGELLTVPTTEPFATLQGRIDQNPRLTRFVSEARVAQANVRLAEAKRWPTLRPSVGVRRYEATDDFAAVAGVTIALPVLNRNQGRVTESRAALSRTRADAEATRVRVHTALFEVYEELQHHLHRASTLRDDVIPRLAKALDETRRGYEKGRYSYFEWRSVQADLLEARNELVEASTGAHRLVIALERLTGERVTKS
jgi:cobalt-zinc-cadmium efflux system outer membrane protein